MKAGGFFLFVALLLSGATASQAQDRAGLDHFEKKIRPVLVDHCYRCHSAGADRVKAGLLLDTREGLILLSGCGHAGLINTVDFARSRFEMAPIYAAVGGFHLLDSTDEHLAWTAEKLRNAGLQHFLGAHCTGIEAVYQIREAVRLTRGTCVVGAVGASYSLEGGIQPLSLAK